MDQAGTAASDVVDAAASNDPIAASTTSDSGSPGARDPAVDSGVDSPTGHDDGGDDHAQPVALARMQSDVRGLAVDAKYVYWSKYQSEGSTWGAAKEGSAPALIGYSQDYPMAVATDVDDSGKIYWTNWGGNTRPGEPHGAVTVGGFGQDERRYSPSVFNQNHPAAIAVDATQVYWANNGSGTVIVDVKNGPANARQLVGSQPEPFAIAADPGADGAVFYLVRGTASDGSQGSLRRVAKTGGDPVVLAEALSFTNALFDFDNIALDGSFVYVATATKIIRVATDGSHSSELIASTAGVAHGIAVDDRFVYWSEWSSPGELRRAPKSGGSVATIAHVEAPTAIEVDASAVYWADTSSASVMKLSK